MILPDYEIEARCRDAQLIDPYSPRQLQPASYDVRLADVILVPHLQNQKPIDLREPPEDDRTQSVVITQGFLLWQGRFVLGSTVERVNIPADLVGRVEGKSTRARQGLQIHSAGYLDPGFRGNVTLELVNFGPDPVVLWPEILIAQFSFEAMVGPCRRPYSATHNHYQDSTGVIGAAGTQTEWVA